jgi:hypothetical protein
MQQGSLHLSVCGQRMTTTVCLSVLDFAFGSSSAQHRISADETLAVMNKAHVIEFMK